MVGTSDALCFWCTVHSNREVIAQGHLHLSESNMEAPQTSVCFVRSSNLSPCLFFTSTSGTASIFPPPAVLLGAREAMTGYTEPCTKSCDGSPLSPRAGDYASLCHHSTKEVRYFYAKYRVVRLVPPRRRQFFHGNASVL